MAVIQTIRTQCSTRTASWSAWEECRRHARAIFGHKASKFFPIARLFPFLLYIVRLRRVDCSLLHGCAGWIPRSTPAQITARHARSNLAAVESLQQITTIETMAYYHYQIWRVLALRTSRMATRAVRTWNLIFRCYSQCARGISHLQ